MFRAARDVVSSETNRWEEEMTYFFIWTMLNRKVGGLLSGEGTLLWVRLASFICLFIFILFQLFAPPCCLHAANSAANMFLTDHNIGHLSPTAETTLLRYTVFLED